MSGLPRPTRAVRALAPRETQNNGQVPAETLIVSGQIPPLPEASVARPQTGLSPASVSPGMTVVLVPAEGPAGSGPGGLGGTGKTHLAVMLAQALHRDHGVKLVFWVTATSRDAVVSSYAQALRDVGMPGPGGDPELGAVQFLVWLARTDRPWLMVLDDLSDGAVLDGLWPRGPAGRVLVTTELQDAAAGAANPQVVPVGPLSPREALAYLSTALHLDKGQLASGLDLAEDLGLLPLALSQAAAVMNVLGISCREYRSRLAENRARLICQGTGGPLLTLMAVWLLSVETADGMAPAGRARRALMLASALAPHGAPALVLTADAACEYLTGQPGEPAAQRVRAGAAVHSLAQAGLISIDPGSAAGTVLVHPLVQAVTRHRPPARERRQAALAAAEALVQAWTTPEVPPAVVQRLRECAASLHNMAGPLLWVPDCHPVLLQAGRSLESSGLTGPAASYWQAMLTASQQALGPRHPRTLLIRDQYAAACAAAGRLTEVIATRERALAEQQQIPGISPADSGIARTRLARAYSAAGRYDDAIRLAREALADFENEPGSQASRLSAREDLAGAYLGAGQLFTAVDTFRQLLALREETQGRDHPQTVAARGQLAAACRAAGLLKEAITLGRRALADFERICGSDHVDALAARAALAAGYGAAKKHKLAIPLYERTLADRVRVQGPDHPDAISASADLAAAYQSAGRLGSAVSQHEQTLAACDRVYGPDHPRTGTARSNLNASADHAYAVRGIDLRTARRR
jgi:tetratricopeptide (TPR) repeat protein